jgi:polyhydroxybutyrate depolymerase
VKLSALLSTLTLLTVAAHADTRHELRWKGQTRDYYLHEPALHTRLSPLVVVMHGGGGGARGIGRFTHFSRLADREGFLVSYPDGIDRHWNDGRGQTDVDDVGFIRAMIAEIPGVDHRRVYVTGISNGAIMTNRLAVEASDLFAAAAPVAGNLPVGMHPRHELPMLIINGTDDPLVPYGGGQVGKNSVPVQSVTSTVAAWCRADGCADAPRTQSLPDLDPNDGCRVTRSTYGKGQVQLLSINGGGHTWPGGTQYLPKTLIGNVCRDFDAAEVIWDFFKSRRRGPE